MNTSESSSNNTFLFDGNFNFNNNPGLVFVLISCTCTGLWLFFLTFYLSRITGFVLTKILQKYYLKSGNVSIGSFSMSLLSGKFTFKDIRYITKDFSIIVIDGQIILKWWLTYDAENVNYYKKFSKDQDICESTQSRLTFYLNGLEVHYFNRSDLYNDIQNILKCERYGDARKSITSLNVLETNIENRKNNEDSALNKWRELFPLIRFNIRSGKLALGNRLLETTLWVHFNKGSAAYSMPDALSTLDYYTHFFQCKFDDLRVLLSKSSGYAGTVSEPPRFMGQGFVVLQSGQAKVLYYQDEPGLVPDDAAPDSDPEWGLNVMFTKSTNITYGPWVDKQREALQKFFFPNNFQELAVTKPMESMQQRLHTGFDVKVEFTASTTLDLLFSKDKETSAVHICCSNPSFLHYYQPWVVNEYGYTSNIIALLQKVDVTTSLQFRKFLESEQIEIAINMMVPRIWNHFQHWSCEVGLSKTTCHFVSEHQKFFNDLITDWSSNEPPDIAKFVPFDWVFNFNLRDFEIILLVNEYNWIECANQDENNELAICGETLEINFTIPNTSFLPELIETNFIFRFETIMLRMFVSESNTLRRSIISLATGNDKNMNKIPNSKSFQSDGDFHELDGNFDEVDGVCLEDQLSQGWRYRTKSSDWVDVWSTPVFLLNIDYKHHPIPIENDTIKNINLKCGLSSGKEKNLDELAPDILTIILEGGPSAVRLFGYFWKQFFVGFKENYFGANQKMSEFNANKEYNGVNANKCKFNANKEDNGPSNASKKNVNQLESSSITIDGFHPLEVNVTVVLIDIHAELTMHTVNKVESPQAFTDRITFEIRKTYHETKMQLIIAPLVLVVPDSLKRHIDSAHLSTGFFRLSGFQFRGHAMFSERGISVVSETIEYSWLTEIQCGNFTGKVTPSQLQPLTLWAETFILHFIDAENRFRLQYNFNGGSADSKDGSLNQQSIEDLKYQMFRFSLESVNVFLAETECACNILVAPVRFAVCNASAEQECEGGSLFINEATLRFFLQQSNFEYSLTDKISKSINWVEVGVVTLGAFTADIRDLCKSTNQTFKQYCQLTFHDEKSKRLWFLWDSNQLKSKLSVDRMKNKMCGCIGGCDFFGKNVNGVRFFTTQVLDATTDSSNHYGSGSLWGSQSTTGEKVKEYLRKLSGFVPKNILSSEDSSVEKLKRKSEIFSDQDGEAGSVPFTFLNKLLNRSKGSKMNFKRSASVIASQPSLLRKFGSTEGSFYSCASESNIAGKIRSMKDVTSSQLSDASIASSSSQYASAVTSVQDLSVNLDEHDHPTLLIKPLCQPALLAAYGSYLQSLTCINWPQKIPSDLQKNFNLLNNLKVIRPPGYHYSTPNLPYFKPNVYGNNIQGKLPFYIDQYNFIKEEEDNDTFTSSEIDKSSKRYINAKLHDQVVCILTPLVTKVVDRYISAFESSAFLCHPCHLLDHFHLGCISRSKDKYKESCILKTFSQNESSFPNVPIDKVAPSNITTVNLKLPHLNFLFFQISTESYTPSDTNSINGQCGSEYSFDVDVKNLDYVMLALSISNTNLNLHQQLEDSSLNNTVVNFFQKFAVAKDVDKHEIMHKLEALIKPSSTVFESYIGNAQLQLLHLKGHTDKLQHFTEIPQFKSNVNFSVKYDRSLCTHINNDAIGEDIFGNIICEAGVEGIKIKFVNQDEINIRKFINSDLTSNIDSELLNVKKENRENNECFLHDISRSSLNSISDWQKVRKGYISLDIETGENLSEPLVTFGGSNAGLSQQVLYKQSSKCIDNVRVSNSCSFFGDMTLIHVWINLATPTHLKTVQKATDQDINLVTVLIPAISTWIPCVLDLIKTFQSVHNSYKILNYSTLACLMSQSLPENGKLFKKHLCIISAVSEESSFLQSDYSSQLISVLRRHTSGQRLANLLQTLKKPSLCPGLKDLDLGMQALSRQWKCIFIGAEGFENIFAVKNLNIRKPVVGRGVLTPKDLRVLLNEKKTEQTTVNPPSDQKNSTMQMEDEPLLDSDSDTESDHQNVKGKEQSLYDWMSRSPASVRSLNKQKESVDHTKQANFLKERTAELENLQSVSQMVSFPTSGMQLAEAADVFSSLLSVVGLITKKHLPSRMHNKYVFQANKVSISLIESEVKKAKESTTSFEMFDTKLCYFSDLKKSISSQYDHIFAVNIRDLKQHFDFPLVRLVLQISETCNVFLEHKKFAEKFIFQPNPTAMSISVEQQHELHVSKSWRNMYNVINLYIPNKSSPTMRENKNRIKQDLVHDEKVSVSSRKDLPLDKLSISGTFCLNNASWTASISGLEFSLDMQQLNASLYHASKKKSTKNLYGASHQNEAILDEEKTTLTVHMEEAKLCLLDSFFKKCAPNTSELSRVLMTGKIYKTNGIYNKSKCENVKSKLKTLLNVGPFAVEIPQHPGTILFVSNHFNKKLHKYFSEIERYKMSIRESQHASSDNNESNTKESLASFNTQSLFRFSICSILVSATLLPSLKVEYKTEQITGFGNFNGKFKFALDLPQHSLSFKTKNQIVPLPASSYVFLPAISIDGHYIQISKNVSSDNSTYFNSHGYLSVGINIGPLEQNLTTDLMNHLIFLQKGFIKEVNEVVQDVEENEPIPYWFSSYEEVLPPNPLIYSIQLKISLIHVTASIPSGTAVVFKTGVISVEFSNQNPSASVLNFPQDVFLKLYGNVQFTVDLSLGQFIKCINSVKQDFVVFASFKTSLNIANTHDNQNVEKRKETIMVTLEHPRVLIKLPAVDKGVLVYLHFKNGFDQWKNQRRIISSDFPTVVEHLFTKKSQENFNRTMDLVLQTNIIGMGVCLPLQDFEVQQGESFLSGLNMKNEHGHSLVITIQEMSISCCSSGSFVSTGLFRRFCLQFNESFDHTALQWIVNEQELMNTYCIPEGSYQLCSKTTTATGAKGLPSKWSMTLFWKMCGIDIHVDSNIGKQLRLLTNALTTIVGESDVADLSSVVDADIEDNDANEFCLTDENDIFNRSMSLNREYSLDKQLWIQTNLVNNLRRENADNELIAREVKILQEIENALSVEFFKDVKMLFRQKSSRRDTFDSKNSYKLVSSNQEQEISKTNKVKFDNDIGNSERKYFNKNLSENDLHNTAKIPPSSVGMDFEFNIVVDIDSGKCSLHLNNPIDNDISVTENLSMVDVIHKPPLIKADSFNVKFRSNQSAASVLSSHAMSDESLVLLIPGVNARVHYLSSSCREAAFADNSDADSNCSSKKYVNKIGSLSCVLSIQSLPKEMILRPSLLDFIEKALEPIMNYMQDFDEDVVPATISGLSSSGSGLYSFPVNVVVVVRIDPSDIRFSCLPTSKVECLLRIPSLNFAITSSPPLCTVPYSSSPKKQNKLHKKISTSSFVSEDDSISNTFSCTACLSRFSFCIFHPYGKQYPILTDAQSQNTKSDNGRPISGRKDSLSLNVEFIKFNLSRKRTKLHTDTKESENRTAVKVSVICDIGSAAFNCDMRRTHEILDVPKAWYKHNLMRRMFLGKEGTYATSMTREGKLLLSTSKAENSIPNSLGKLRSNQPSISSPIKSAPRGHRRAKSAVFLENLIGSFPSHRNTFSKSQNESSVLDSHKEVHEAKIPIFINGSEACSEWETNLVLTINVSHVDVSTNTGNVMGQAVWNTSDLRLNAGVLVNNLGLKTNTAELSMRQSSFNTHGGVIGGSIEVQDINSIGKFSENVKENVSHKANLTIKSAEIRLDYMGSCIIMTSLSLFKVKLDNEWPFKLINSSDSNEIKMFVKCDVTWDELQVIMSRSTASDSTKLLTKLEEFFNQQHQSSVKLLYSLHKFDNSVSQLRMSIGEPPEKDTKRALKYQHWIKLLMNFEEIPNKNVLIGGKLLIKGNFLSLACFHGSNFRSQNWALFTMREPCVEFTSETKVVEKSCQVYRGLCLQKGTFTLGKKTETQLFERRQSMESLSDFMATVRRVSRGRRNPPSLGAPVHEWLVFINTVNAHDLPFSNKGKEISEKLTHVKLGSGLRKVSFAPKYRYENDSEVIFGLPQLSLLLVTEHDQPTSCFNLNDPKEFGNAPHLVDTQLLSSFGDSISVTMDASLYFFLHDLILSYMKEKQSTGGSRLSRKLNVDTAEDPIESRNASIATECKYREFRSKGWKVEPRVRFLSWAGQQIDPVSIDWVLEKLGFMHAALTIPKWAQRGALDPLDLTLARLMEKLLAFTVKENTK